ncbi:heterokaryon incompatibility protein-domain-containing protein, partial [Diaporthe sp. PMI_573]
MSISTDIPLFHHEPLQDPRNYIRLLYVVLVDTTVAAEGIEVQCRLTTRRFNPRWESRIFNNTEFAKVRPLYHAISYVWGSPDEKVPILVNGRRMEVGRNCEYALKQSAWYGGACYVWCDAICIDQTNDDEKGHQVYMMGDIYRNAEAVLACVGAHADGS